MKRSTWILLALLAIAIGAYYLLQKKAESPDTESEVFASATPDSYLVSEPGDVLTSIRLFDRQYDIVELQRNEIGLWTITLPSEGAAEPALVGAAEAQIAALRIVTAFDAPPDLGAAGLLSPGYTLKLGYASGTEHIVEVGNLTPTRSGYYVRLDNDQVFIVSIAGIDALTNLLVSPPYVPSMTPTAEPSPTPEMTNVGTP